ncbi:hypothetical protein MY11210_004570 [Beauveria gryllotalpidicola]
MSSSIPKLRGPKTWDAWFTALENHALNVGAWEFVNPDYDDYPDDALIRPVLPTLEKEKEKLTRALNTGVANPTAEGGALKVPSEEAVKKELEEAENRYDRMIKDYRTRKQPMDQMASWLLGSVDPIASNQVRPLLWDGITLKQKIRLMRQVLAPSKEDAKKEASYAYDNVLNTGKAATMKASKWIEKWEEAYAQAHRHKIPEIESALAIDKFLDAVKAQFDEPWATAQQQIIIARSYENQGPPHSLVGYARIFREVTTLKERTAAQVYAVSTPKPDNSSTRGKKNNNNNNNNDRGSHECPCGRTFKDQGGHKWRPYDCRFVRTVVKAPVSVPRGFPPTRVSEQNAKDILSRLKEPKWKELRNQFSNAGYHIPSGQGNDQTKAQGNIDLPDGDLICAFEQTDATSNLLLYSTALQHVDEHDIVASAAGSRHRLHNSTIWDTGAALHVVNEMKFLDEGTFRVERGAVGAGKSECAILGYGNRTLKGDVQGANGTRNVVLQRVALVEGFHVNIISVNLMKKAGIWMCGLDNTLRYGSYDDNIIIKKIEVNNNLHFWDFRPIK